MLQQRFVRLGEERGDFVSVTEGLSAGEEVVTTGVFKAALGHDRGGRQQPRAGRRPVPMTSIATVAGHFPLTLVTGAGAAARNSIGLVLVGGMAIGTLFTLFVVPSVYVLLARDHSRERESPMLEPAPGAQP